jgi:hypothetical protein
MRKSIAAACVFAVTACVSAVTIFGHASPQAPAQAPLSASGVIKKAETALGGDRLMAAKSLRIEGWGQDALQNGGGNASPSPDAPQRWDNDMNYEETIDLANHRVRVKQRSAAWLPAATMSRVIGNVVTTAVLDGDVPYNVTPQGARRANANAAEGLRVDMLTYPASLVRMALDSATTVDNARTEGHWQLVDIHPKEGPRVTLATDRDGLPVWVRWMENNGVLRDLTMQRWFTGYEPINGVMMPTGFKTVSDFRNTIENQLYVTRNSVDVPTDDLAAPSDVKSAAAPPPPPAITVEATPVAKGIWIMHGRGENSILIEFADHLALFELATSNEWAQAVIDKAKTVVPGKPVTQDIVSHHHFDHAGGIRQAIANGLTVIAVRGNDVMFRDVAARKSSLVPDDLSKNPKPLKFIPVDDHMTLKDSTMEIQLYHIIGYEHMTEGLMAYEPADRLLIEGDLFDVTWQNYPWGNVYADNIKLRNLDVAQDVPVHGMAMPWKDVYQSIQTKIAGTKALCAGPMGPLLPECEVMR